MHREPDVGFDPGSPGSRPGQKAGAKPLRHPGIPGTLYLQCSTQEILEEMFCGFNSSNSLDNDRVLQANKEQCCSEVRMGRGFSTERWPPRKHGEKPGALP